MKSSGKWISTLLVGLLTTAFPQSQPAKPAPSPDLKETLEWMSRTVSSATLTPRESHGWFTEDTARYLSHSRTSIVFGLDAQHLEGKAVGCYAEISEIMELTDTPLKEKADKRGSEGHTVNRVLQFNLKDIDPNRVKAKNDDIDPKYHPHVVGAVVEFYATDDKPMIRKRSAVWNVDSYYYTSKENLVSCTGPDKECTEKEQTIETGDVAVDSLEFAQRFAKAFHHAVELCGGKPSAF